MFGAQCVVSQSVRDSVSGDSIVLADDEIEAWLDKYANVSQDTISVDQDTIQEILVDKKRSDFTEFIDDGNTAREKEKNALIKRVFSTLRDKTDSSAVETVVQKIKDVEKEEEEIVDDISLAQKLSELELQISVVDADSILVDVDSKSDSIKLSTNPLFMDWVLGLESPVSTSLNDEDSIIIQSRKYVKDHVRGTAPELYTYHKSQLPSISELQTSRITHSDREKLLLNLDSLNKKRASHLTVNMPEISKWTKGAKFQVHASQNYISSNWYKGGESNLAATFYVLGFFNYDNKEGFQWDNKAEWKLGLYGMVSDSLRWLRVNEDLLRLNSKLGFKAFKNFYYTAELDIQTSLFNTYKSNTYIRTSGPFSPIRMNLSLGVDYKYKSIVSVFVSPLSYKLVYVADTSIKQGVLPTENIAHQVGITDGTRQSNQLGALVRTDFDYDFNESIGMEVHFSFFGNYVGKIKGVEIGCEVVGNFKINRFLSAKVSLYPRYDSTTIPADGGKPKMQFYELISLGFNYKL